MKRKLLFLFASAQFLTTVQAQNVDVFNDVTFYSMYHYLGEGETLPAEAYNNLPDGALRFHAYEQDVISRKLTYFEIADLGSSVTMNVTLFAACDNYDRLAGVSLALVPKGSTSYTWDQSDVKRIELARFITPFMNKNVSPTSVPYSYKIDNLSALVYNTQLAADYDFWIEFRADGYSAAAQQQVAGCSNRTDVFRGTLQLASEGSASNSSSYFLPISYRQNLNNYNSTDVVGETTRIVNFTLDTPVDNAKLYFINSNHGSNTNGEEYIRRQHYIYLDDNLVFEYKPGGGSCEPYRVYNTQGNGIYGSSAKTLRNWLSWNNWCPGAAIPNREINLGNLSAGTHTIKIDVPDAVFSGQQGNFPISMYIQNAESGQIICAAPTALEILNQAGTSVSFGWNENGNSTTWEALWGRKNIYATTTDVYQDVEGEPVSTRDDLSNNWYYEMYVKSKCTDDSQSEWVGPLFTTRILSAQDIKTKAFQVYPNPTKETVTVQSKNIVKKLELYSVDGKKLQETTSINLNLGAFPKGIYIVKAEFQDGNIATEKIIKE